MFNNLLLNFLRVYHTLTLAMYATKKKKFFKAFIILNSCCLTSPTKPLNLNCKLELSSLAARKLVTPLATNVNNGTVKLLNMTNGTVNRFRN